MKFKSLDSDLTKLEATGVNLKRNISTFFNEKELTPKEFDRFFKLLAEMEGFRRAIENNLKDVKKRKGEGK